MLDSATPLRAEGAPGRRTCPFVGAGLGCPFGGQLCLGSWPQASATVRIFHWKKNASDISSNEIENVVKIPSEEDPPIE